MDSPFMGGRLMDSPYTGRVADSPFLRAQEAKYGHTSGFSLGPGMHEAGASDGGGGGGGGAVDTPQSTADLTAFVQNLLQQMQLRFQSMSDAIIVRIDEMASRIEELEKAVDDVLREVTTDEDGVLPSPSSSPIRKPLGGPAAPPSPDIRKLMGGSGSFSGVPNSPSVGRYGSTGTPDIRRQVSAAAALGVPKSPDLRRHSGQGLYVPNVPNSPDPRRHSTTGIYGSGAQVGNSPDVRRQTLPGDYSSPSPDVRKNTGAGATNVLNSPDPRRRTDTYATGTR